MTLKSSTVARVKKSRLLKDRGVPRATLRPRSDPLDFTRRILPEELFLGMLCLERKRAERSGTKFALILLDARSAVETGIGPSIFGRIFKAVDAARRETDLAGWYKEDAILGVIFTELGKFPESATSEMLRRKIYEGLAGELTPQELQLVHVSLHIFGDDSDDRGSDISNPAFYPDIFHQNHVKKFPLAMKRT